MAQFEPEEGRPSTVDVHPDKNMEEFLRKNELTSLRDSLIENNLSLTDIANIQTNDASEFNEVCDLLKLKVKEKLKFRTALKKLQQINLYNSNFKQLQSKYIVTKTDERYLQLYQDYVNRNSMISISSGNYASSTGNYNVTGSPNIAPIRNVDAVLAGEMMVINAIVIGESRAGKTSMLLKMTRANFTLVEDNVSSTIDIDSINIMIDIGHGMSKYDHKNESKKNTDKLGDNLNRTKTPKDSGIVSLNLWDSAGQEKYRNDVLNKTILRNKDAIVMCYDISNNDSFNKLSKWYEQVSDIVDPKDVAVLIVGCKKDKTIEQKQQNIKYVIADEAQKYASKISASWSDCSAKTGEGIIETLLLISQRAYKRKKRQMKHLSVVKENLNESVDLNRSNTPQNAQKCGC